MSKLLTLVWEVNIHWQISILDIEVEKEIDIAVDIDGGHLSRVIIDHNVQEAPFGT